MNRKRIALLTGLTLLTGTSLNNTNLLKHSLIHNIEASKTSTNSKQSEKYPDIMKKLDVTSMQQYSSQSLFMNITMNKFYIKDIASNSNKTHLILVPIKTSNQYFILTLDSNDKNISVGQKITIHGFLNGKVRINNKYILAGLNKKYLNKKVVSVMADDFKVF